MPDSPAWIAVAVAVVGFVSAVAALLYKPQYVSGLTALVDNLQEEVERLTTRVDAAETTAREARRVADVAIAENAELVDHHLDTVRGVAAGTVPPWLPIPRTLRHRLDPADYPPVVVVTQTTTHPQE